jgi:hypothetical protein
MTLQEKVSPDVEMEMENYDQTFEKRVKSTSCLSDSIALGHDVDTHGAMIKRLLLG